MPRHSIRKQLAAAFFGLAFIPVFVVMVVVCWQTFMFHRDRALGFQEEVAKRVATQLDAFFNNIQNDLSLLANVHGLREKPQSEQESMLSSLLSTRHVYQELALLDPAGHERFRFSRLSVITAADLLDRHNRDEFRRPFTSGTTYYGPVRFDPETGEPLMLMSHPLLDPRTGRCDGVIVSDIRLKYVWNLMARVQVEKGEGVFVVDAQSKLIAHRDPSVVLRGAYFSPPSRPGIGRGRSSRFACLASERIYLGDQTFDVVVERSLFQEMQSYMVDIILVALVVLLPTLLVGHVVANRMARSIFGRIQALSDTAKAIERGDLFRRAEVTDDDEIGDLARSFNSMTAQLRHSLETLEQEIADRHQAEEARWASEHRYRVLLQGLPLPVFHKSRDLAFVSCNASFAKSLGLERTEDVTGRTDFDFFPPELADKYRSNDQRVIELGHTEEVEEPFFDRGEPRIILSVKTPLKDDSGRIVGLLGIIWDITERKLAEQALRASEQRYRTLVDNLPQHVFQKSPGSVFVSCNAVFARSLGIQPEAIPGKTDFDFYPADLAEKYRADDARVIALGVTCDIEERHVRQGETRFVHVVKTPLRDEAGGVTGLLGIFWDITERKRAEEALRASEARYRLLAENVSDIIWTMGFDLRFTYVSPSIQAVDGYTVEEAMALSLDQYLTPESIEKVSEVFKQEQVKYRVDPASISDSHTLELQRCRKDGTFAWAEVIVSILRDVENHPTGLLGVSRDVTQRKRLQEQIQHAQKLESLGVLAGGIAHDFNNLLMGILGNASLALMETPAGAKTRRNLEQIETAGMRAAELAKQMLAYSGKGKFVVEAISLSNLVEEMAHLLETAISKRAALKYDFIENLPLVEADATQLRQVVMNLIVNASEALGDKNGVITVSTGVVEADKAYLRGAYVNDDLPEGFYVFMEVTDTGCGMDEETRKRIFDPFFTTKFMGRGLGLAAVLGIIRGHKGAIRVYSEPGKGSAFKVLLPCSSRSLPTVAARVDTEAEWMGSGLILVVDDEQTVRVVARMMLEKFGFTVITANDGAEAVEVFKQYADEIRAVLLDMTMPRLNGEQAFSEFRRIRADVRVILSSGYNEQEATNRFAGKGLAGFIQKPYQPNTLIRKVRQVLGENAS